MRSNAKKIINKAIKTGLGRNTLIENISVKVFLEKIPLKEAVYWAVKIDDIFIWKLILGRPEISLKKALKMAEESGKSVVWENILKRSDVQEYLKKIPLNEIVRYIKRINIPELSNFVISFIEDD